MPIEIREHPDTPDLELFESVTVEPVPIDEIERKREQGLVLVEDNVRTRDDLDVMAYLSPDSDGAESHSIGVGLYRLVQLFGTPQFPEFRAGEDISHRTNSVFKYLFRVDLGDVDTDDEEIPQEWLFTVHDTNVRYAASVAEWREDDEEFTAPDDLALATYALAQQLIVDPVPCVYEDIPY